MYLASPYLDDVGRGGVVGNRASAFNDNNNLVADSADALSALGFEDVYAFGE